MISYHAAVFWLLCKKSLCLSTLSIKFKGKVVLKYFDIIFKSLKILCISLNKFRKSEREKSRMHHKIIIKCTFHAYVFRNLYNPRVLLRAFLFEYIFLFVKT